MTYRAAELRCGERRMPVIACGVPGAAAESAFAKCSTHILKNILLHKAKCNQVSQLYNDQISYPQKNHNLSKFNIKHDI